MKRIFVSIILLTLVSCAWAKTQKTNIDLCWQDVTCRTEAIVRAKDYGQTASQVGQISGVPWAGSAAQVVIGFGSLLLLLSAGGAAMKKKEDPK